MADRGIAPGLLVASPDLREPTFMRSVILMVQHDEHSSFGLVVNHPTGVRVSAAQNALHVDWPDDSDAELFRGGPCEPSPGEPLGFVLHYPSGVLPQPSEAPLEGADGIVLYTIPPDPESLAKLEAERPHRVRFVVGYSRWSAGQLEMELLQGCWLVADANPQIIFETPVDAIWEAAVRSIGIDPDSLLPGSLIAGPAVH